jgi:ubiquinone/menaquinone biosynthesis C-methylase UbiE
VRRLRAALYDALAARFERAHGARLRRRQLEPAAGRVLEVGGGTGANLPHYPPSVHELVLTEPDDAMLRRARTRAAACGRRVELVVAAAESLPFADGAFDTVVTTLALCTVADQPRALREIRRVLRPGGQLLFAEHVRSGDPRLARWQDRLERPWRVVAGGCRPNRDTGAALGAAGFRVEVAERGDLPAVPALVRPYILGRAVVPD